MGVNMGKSYGTANDFQLPVVTHEMYLHAVKVVCGLAWSADDARFLLETLGVPEDVIAEARQVDGHEFGLV